MVSTKTSSGFLAVVLAALGLLGFIGLMLIGGLLGLNETIAAMGHFGTLRHRFHDLTYALLFGAAAVGLIAQTKGPARNAAGMLMASVPWASLTLAFALGGKVSGLFQPPFVPIFGMLTLLAALLHPSVGRTFRRSIGRRVDMALLALVLVAAVPLLVFAHSNTGLQRSAADDHAVMGHYAYMAAFAMTVLAVGVLAAMRPQGWIVAAWTGGLLPALLGLASLMLPHSGSSLGPGWAVAALAWGAGFVATSGLRYRTEMRQMAEHTPGTNSNPDTGGSIPRPGPAAGRSWGKIAVGIVAVALVALLIGWHLSSGGIGRHGVPSGNATPSSSGHVPPFGH